MFDIHVCLEEVGRILPDQFPLKDFIHQNTLHAFQGQTFHEALLSASSIFGANCYMDTSFYDREYRSGRITSRGISQTLREHFASDEERDVFRLKMFDFLSGRSDTKFFGSAVSGLRQRWLAHIGVDIDKRVHPMLFKILGNYLDQGISIWRLPHIHQDFWQCIGNIVTESILPISPLTDQFCRNLLKLSPEEVIRFCLDKIVGDENLYHSYLTEMLLTHPGWAGMVRVIEKHPDFLHSSRNISLKELLALELCFEIGWLVRKKGVHFRPVASYGEIVEQFQASIGIKEEQNSLLFLKRLWHESYEWSYYNETFDRLQKSRQVLQAAPPPKVQALFCLDDRSCSVRRHLENLDTQIETFGTPGFFGVEFFYQGVHNHRLAKHCPMPLQPKHLVREVSKQKDAGKAPLPSSLVSQKANTLFRGWFITQILGVSAALRLAFAVFQPFLRFTVITTSESTSQTELELLRTVENTNVQGLYAGYTFQEMAERVAGVLRSIGMTEYFAPLVVLLAHGSSSVNNPHFAAYDCGACSGKHGSPNARSFAWMANRGEVRELLRTSGIDIPETTRFVPAMHNTTTDEVTYFDIENLSAEHRAIFGRFHSKINTALDLNAKERCKNFELAHSEFTPAQARMHVKMRAAAIFEPRPELNHANNALCIVGKRGLTKGISLDRRAFLQSYDSSTDKDGETLARILGAVVPVCGGINLEYFFSRIDNNVYGAGTKLPHNINGLIGVTNGVQGDLRTGLPSQMTEIHEPVRLMIVVEHTPEIAEKAVKRNRNVFQWIENKWVRYAVIHPETKDVYVWRESGLEKVGADEGGLLV